MSKDAHINLSLQNSYNVHNVEFLSLSNHVLAMEQINVEEFLATCIHCGMVFQFINQIIVKF